ncbi:MAG: calcium/sodium antiporter [Candidatus Thiodiazotropha sp. (ex Lucina aurantia)]|uniref:Inner membrane protein YrbG n=2 Tax=Candidatus Thiodiazotropha TaxID=1913444 RepID=A0A7Z0VLR2_9GAMM|nr:calcium/sodium antiporter [Candidatus Thiodiazotropha endolucinida]MBT3013117.1 calcium/sodium antiporter [Candidatus Thiodiazotropha sp. (ex Lucina pensylvanica)]MBT3017135.1 calcium/sodium antiporter [Candidatus Thiodiazotropha taylori]MBT3040689.1 calcium/sodium antiporter [Candidatus Thiodiazotropha sp. (ex Codakia orbicularis)]MBV2104600.1 calcium/sodium antiporter [Candidatus Thiodiazotropha sp. (ex Lucina aurantia)]MBT3023827.1 calcium/sodium antiporter [Candidatus Thiodiazotropha ta
MFLFSVAILVGLVVLVWSADRFISGAAALADNLGVSPMLIGLTVVGFGTSAPEVLVSTMASFNGNPGLAIGNAIGSNIANIGLILGFTALVIPLSVHSSVLRREYPLLLAVSAMAFLLMWDGELNQLDGVILVVTLVAVLGWMIYTAKTGAADPIAGEFDAEIPHDIPTQKAIVLLLGGLIFLLLSSRLLVWGASNVASALGVSDVIIGLTIVAIGTSLPELAASITSALKGEDDLAIGNVIGSNLYNLLAVLSIPGLVAPGTYSPEVMERDLPVMMVLTMFLFFMGHGLGKQGRINRLEGLLLLLCFIGYQSLLFVSLVNA